MIEANDKRPPYLAAYVRETPTPTALMYERSRVVRFALLFGVSRVLQMMVMRHFFKTADDAQRNMKVTKVSTAL